METNTTTDVITTVLTAIDEAKPNGTTIRNAATFGHVIRPRRTRAAFIVSTHSDPTLVNVAAFNGQGHVIDAIVGTPGEAIAYIVQGY